MKKICVLLFLTLSLNSCERFVTKVSIKNHFGEQCQNKQAYKLFEKAYDSAYDINGYRRDFNSQEMKNAIEYIDKALELEPNNFLYKTTRDDFFWYSDNYIEKIRICKEKATEVFLKGNYLACLGSCFDKMGEKDSAIFYYQQALKYRFYDQITEQDLEQKKLEARLEFLISSDKEKTTRNLLFKVDTLTLSESSKTDLKGFINDLDVYSNSDYFLL